MVEWMEMVQEVLKGGRAVEGVLKVVVRNRRYFLRAQWIPNFL